jgi:hypothetical protein
VAVAGPRVTRRTLSVALASTLLLAACEKPARDPQEAAARVLAKPEWVEDARLCPVDVMSADMRVQGTRKFECADEKVGRCLASCVSDNVDACYWLAQTLVEEKQDEAAVVLFQRSCMLGEPSGCTNRAAAMLNARRQNKAAQSCTTRTFEKTGELKDSWGCTMYGSALHAGLGVPVDDARALEMFDKACVLSGANPDASCDAAKRLTTAIRGEPAP